MKILENLEWRYATKRFDNRKKVSPDNLEKLKRSIQLAASSYGLQLYKVLIIEDDVLKKRLKPCSWNQSQITDCSHLFVFCNYSDIKEQHIDEYIELKSQIEGKEATLAADYGNFIKIKLSEKTSVEKTGWLKSQCYLALGNLLSACAELHIDACPMEGFDPEDYNKILQLNEKGLNACVIAAVGYRHIDDETQFKSKIRKPIEKLFEKF